MTVTIRNTTSHDVDLESGQVLPAGGTGYVDELSEREQALVVDGVLADVSTTADRTEPPTNDDALAAKPDTSASDAGSSEPAPSTASASSPSGSSGSSGSGTPTAKSTAGSAGTSKEASAR